MCDAMTYTPEEHRARYHARHRDEINAAQRARYHERKAAGTLPPSQRPKCQQSVTGTLGAIEAPDSVESTAPNLREKYLFALLTRDAAIWHEHEKTFERGANDEALSSTQAQRIAPHATAEAPKTRPKTRPKRSLVFYGRQCQTCGGTERYISTGNCVACSKASTARSNAKKRADQQKSAAREAAIAAGAKTYMRELPCPRCGGNVYRVNGYHCIACKSAAKRARRGESLTPAGAKPSVPRLAQFKRLGTFQAGCAPRMPQRLVKP
jgi:hypothetical protein